jgi:serine/threonine protein kinase
VKPFFISILTIAFLMSKSTTPLNLKSRVSLVKRIRRRCKTLLKKFSTRTLNALISVDLVVKPAHPTDSNTFVFKGKFMGCNVYGKLMWREVASEGSANTERKLMEQELEEISFHGMSPCFPLRYESINIERNMFEGTDMHTNISGLMREGGGGVGCEGVRLMLIEDCGDASFASFCNQQGDASDLHAIIFMLFHALSYMKGFKLSHHDLHADNIIITSSAPARVSFGDRHFVTSTAVRIIDWDLGRSEKTPNDGLKEYGHVGIFNEYNALFDTVGLLKTFISVKQVCTSPGCRAQSSLYASAIAALDATFTPLRHAYPWIFQDTFNLSGDSDDDELVATRCVQQTPFIPDVSTGVAVSRWPEETFRLAPTIENILRAIYTDMPASKKRVFRPVTFAFPAALRN